MKRGTIGKDTDRAADVVTGDTFRWGVGFMGRIPAMRRFGDHEKAKAETFFNRKYKEGYHVVMVDLRGEMPDLTTEANK